MRVLRWRAGSLGLTTHGPWRLAGTWGLSDNGEKEGNVTLRDATSTSIIATTLAGLLFSGGALPALAEGMTEEQMMKQFGECIRNTCEVRVLYVMAVAGAAAHGSCD